MDPYVQLDSQVRWSGEDLKNWLSKRSLTKTAEILGLADLRPDWLFYEEKCYAICFL